MKLILFILLMAVPVAIIKAQQYYGTRAAGMGNSSVANKDPSSVFSNIGGISAVENVSLVAGYENRFKFEPFSTYSVAIIYPQKFLTSSISVLKFGDELYNRQELALGVGNKFGLARLGAKLNYVQYSVEGYGSRSCWVLEVGGVADLLPKLSIGASIYNLNQSRLSDYLDERLPVILRTGISYKPIEKIFVNIEVEKDIEFDPSVKVGLEYQIVSGVFLRSGVSTKPVASFFGLGFQRKFFQIDYALNNHQILGLSHSLSCAVQLHKKK